jgi:exodeoxyribonuclease III
MSSKIRIATWNINSLRLRLPLLQKLAAEQAPDVICLQETKCPDEHFPQADIAAMGYAHQAFAGMKSYNGVAILSKLPLSNIQIINHCGKEDCRHITAQLTVAGKNVAVHNLYIPAGGDVPDRALNDKFAHKLDFVAAVQQYFEQHSTRHQIAVGDFNIAPLEHDVWSHKQLLNVVSHTAVEIEQLNGWFKTQNWFDALRHFVPDDQKLYTWWSYRNQDWRKSNRGRRLDHVWTSQTLQPHTIAMHVLQNARDWPKPSDHVPVLVDFEF